eukprot:CAMPEP_0206216256 /NCGR_PEP_ID=MMETSP0047_2-20121206/2624_1 /ASSEMBLY_ACC=CAM_ASM_000192 /TAXON_ID=195065 /ORGANISM="Chroomonas mesostigmatica_cf, Strain CCMP1168" /LENGTH=89 /DNA_ID=CAMNT_0053638591 /DNA_START=578 /DNA_END=844 /DNA_ORIENTATION=+
MHFWYVSHSITSSSLSLERWLMKKRFFRASRSSRVTYPFMSVSKQAKASLVAPAGECGAAPANSSRVTLPSLSLSRLEKNESLSHSPSP